MADPVPASAPAAAAGTVSIGGDLEGNRLGFGAMRITGRGIWGPPADHDEAVRVLRRAVELGVEFIDPADAYGPDVSEALIAEALSPYPEGLVIGTKGGLLRGGPGDWRPDGRPEHLRAACEGSLRRLRVDQIALYQLHRPDPAVPLEDSIGELVSLRAEGKIRHIGLSNVSARGLAFLPWAPVGGQEPGEGKALAEVARRHGVSPVQVAIAWQLARAPQVLPIPGTSSVAHLEENVAAASLRLSADDLALLG